MLRVGQSLLIGGLGRLDYVEGVAMPPIRVTIFANEKLPVNVVETVGVEEFMANRELQYLKVVPAGQPRMTSLPFFHSIDKINIE